MPASTHSDARADILPWAELMQFALGVLHMAPRDFWAMTPAELSAALGLRSPAAHPAALPTRQQLQNLMQRFPDHDATSADKKP
jgi:uncharacterized phage protein (TIGR02216 family)